MGAGKVALQNEVGFPKEKSIGFHKAEMASPTIRSIFTSEIAVALLLRWHVKKPNTVVTTKYVGDKLVVSSDTHVVAVYSSVAKKVDPEDRDGWQKALVKAIEVEATTVDGDFAKDFKKMVEQPWWNIPALSRGHEIDRALTTLDERHGFFVLLEPYSVF